VNRGEIWWASLDDPIGSAPGFRRPVVVVSSDNFNASGIRTVIAAVLTSNLRLADAPGNFLLTKNQTQLPKDSVFNVSQIITLDKTLLTEKVGKLGATQVNALNQSLKLVLDL
jgi:mRNA interferase MazF